MSKTELFSSNQLWSDVTGGAPSIQDKFLHVGLCRDFPKAAEALDKRVKEVAKQRARVNNMQLGWIGCFCCDWMMEDFEIKNRQLVPSDLRVPMEAYQGVVAQ